MYTDGSSRGNPGPGGWASILITEHGTTDNRHHEVEAVDERDEVIELGGREDMTTNNRMELMGAIKGLREIDNRREASDSNGSRMDGLESGVDSVISVEVLTDSEYVRKGMAEWIQGWIKKGWKTSTKKDVLNKDLWEQLLAEVTRIIST